MQTDKKLTQYALFKKNLHIEPYLDFLNNDTTARIEYTKLRISAHKLKIETDRYTNTPMNQRLCRECGEIEDEKHFLLKCSLNKEIRDNLFISLMDIFPDFRNLTDEDKFIFMMGFQDYEMVQLVSKFIVNSLENR